MYSVEKQQQKGHLLGRRDERIGQVSLVESLPNGTSRKGISASHSPHSSPTYVGYLKHLGQGLSRNSILVQGSTVGDVLVISSCVVKFSNKQKD